MSMPVRAYSLTHLCLTASIMSVSIPSPSLNNDKDDDDDDDDDGEYASH